MDSVSDTSYIMFNANDESAVLVNGNIGREMKRAQFEIMDKCLII